MGAGTDGGVAAGVGEVAGGELLFPPVGVNAALLLAEAVEGKMDEGEPSAFREFVLISAAF